MRPIVECIPNISEGRRIEVVDAIVQAIAAVPDVAVLHRTSDADHNRSVITFAGPPDAVREAAFRTVAAAARHIDMRQHRGQHPRIGAADVVPFVPIQGVTMADCIQLAHDVGRRIAHNLALPVYLYGEAAQQPDRHNLANVRRGQYEGLHARIADDPARAPDYGPAQLGPAGAVAIGARDALIAFNVYLTTGDVRIAQHIARAIRGSSGGLVGVRALGLLVGGQAQVSMNLIDYQRTPLHRVVEMIRREAQRYGVAIASCELIGLVPQAALLDAAAWYLQLNGFAADRVLETRIGRAWG